MRMAVWRGAGGWGLLSGAVLGGERFVAEVQAACKQRRSGGIRSGEFAREGPAWVRMVEAVEAVHGWRRAIVGRFRRQRLAAAIGEVSRRNVKREDVTRRLLACGQGFEWNQTKNVENEDVTPRRGEGRECVE